MPSGRRLEFSEQFLRARAEAPAAVDQTLANLLAMLVEDQPPDADPILRLTPAAELGLRHPGWVAALGDVMVLLALPADHPVILCLDLIWVEPEAS